MSRERFKWYLSIFSLFWASVAAQESLNPDNEPGDEILPDLNKPPSELHKEYLTGNWGGERQKLEERGVFLALTYFTDIQGNPVGGAHRGFAQAGSMGFQATIDLEKIAQIKGLQLFGSFVWREGTSLSAKKIDNQFPVAQLFGGQTYRLNELYLKEQLADGNVILKAGRLNAGNNFFQSPLYYYFVSNAFCGNPISIFFNSGFSAYPKATWGGYFDFLIRDQFKAQFGVYNVNPTIFKNKYHGCNFTFHSVGGILAIGQFSYLLNRAKTSRGLPGNYAVGYFYQTGEVQRFSGQEQKGNYCYYFLFDQMIYRKGNLNVTPFAAIILAPTNRNLFPFFFDGGIIARGIIKNRADDTLVFGAAYGAYSSDLRQVQQNAMKGMILGPFGNRPQDFELVLELNYWYYVTPYWVITPDLQYIIHPKGHDSIQNALVLGTQIGITF